MKCPNCGEELSPDKLFCDKCGYEIHMVPDYDPLDELMIENEESEPEDSDDDGGEEEETLESPRRKRGLSFPLRIMLLLVGLLVCLAVLFAVYFLVVRENSYSYQLRLGMEAYEAGEYEEAITRLNKASGVIPEDESDAELLKALSYSYALTGGPELAVDFMQEAIDHEEARGGESDELTDLYIDLMDILNITGQTSRVGEVIDDCGYDDIRAILADYRVEKPVSSVPEGTYSYFIRLELEAEYGEIYYTLDGTDPTVESIHYEEAVTLQEEGETLLTAVAINSRGMVSDKLVLVYRLEFQEEE